MIRQLTIHELYEARRIEAMCFDGPGEPDFDLKYLANGGSAIGSFEGPALCAVLWFKQLARGEKELTQIAVHPKHRRRGHARKLILLFGPWPLRAFVHDDNAPSLALLTKLGFNTQRKAMMHGKPGRWMRRG